MALPPTFVGFSGTDLNYYRLMLAWKAHEHIDFDFCDCQCGFRKSLSRISGTHSIRPLGAGGACEALIDDVTTCVLHAEVVDGHVKNSGTTRSLQDRQLTNRNTINEILEFQDGRSRSMNKKITDPSTHDRFKQQAPGVIRDGKKIEIWATFLSSRAARRGARRHIWRSHGTAD
jgi:hypothetical protein